MADISVYLEKILSAIYGEDVRGSIHDAIEIINDVSEVVLSTGTAVTGPTSSSLGFFTDSLYLNTNTQELWKCAGVDTWVSLGTLKGDDGRSIVSITKTSTAGLVDTYNIAYDSGSPDSFTVTNGANGTDGADGSVWYKGTAITGTGTGITGCPGNQNDFYLNSSTGNVYVCTASGTISTATWDYVMTLTGGGGSTITVIDSLVSQSTTDALSANQGYVLKGYVDAKAPNSPTFSQAGSRTNIVSGENTSTLFGKIMKWFADLADLAFIAKDGLSSTKYLRGDGTWQTFPTIPTVNNASLYIQQNGTTAGTFTANASSNVTANIVTDDWVKTASVSSGSVTFSGIDDTTSYGYDVYFEITGNSTNKAPYAKLTTITGSGTSSMSLTYETDADNGTNNAKLRRVK